MFNWNFRFVRDDASNDGEPWFALKEVHYNEQGKPDQKSTRLNSSHTDISRMPSSA